ncbi:MAG: carbon-nitrogen hydrolase family protein, partial [Paenibacillus sp.]|nr:carbon-nitrogen hydrolase family protein [Paenibacillus sp.]
MANCVKVSCIGPAPLAVGDVTPQQAVEKMVAHWRSQVQQVLPEKPDIIVLPEACDRPSGAWREKQKLREFYECRGD